MHKKLQKRLHRVLWQVELSCISQKRSIDKSDKNSGEFRGNSWNIFGSVPKNCGRQGGAPRGRVGRIPTHITCKDAGNGMQKRGENDGETPGGVKKPEGKPAGTMKEPENDEKKEAKRLNFACIYRKRVVHCNRQFNNGRSYFVVTPCDPRWKEKKMKKFFALFLSALLLAAVL
mgnify:CR=1 FL=1